MTKVEQKIKICKAIETDSKSLFDLINALADYEKLQRPDTAAQERLKQDIFGPNPRITAWLASVEALHATLLPVGYAITFYTYSSFLALPTLYIEDIFVLPEYRSCGIGKSLFMHCAKVALENNCGRMEFQVLDWNKSAINFYGKLGAKHMKEWLSFRFTKEEIERLIERSS